MLNKKQIALIHIAKSQCRMSDEDYRALLFNKFGVSSSKDPKLTGGHFDELMDDFIKKGFKPNKTLKKNRRHAKHNGKEPMFKKMGIVLKELDLSWNYADGIARKMFGIDKVLWCDSTQVYKVLQALMYHKKRKLK